MPKKKSNHAALEREHERQRKEQKKLFIAQLAKFLVGNQGAKSIMLEVEMKGPKLSTLPQLAHEWATLRNSAMGLMGYPTVEEAVVKLTEFLK